MDWLPAHGPVSCVCGIGGGLEKTGMRSHVRNIAAWAVCSGEGGFHRRVMEH